METIDIPVGDLRLTFSTHIALKNAKLVTVQDIINYESNKGLTHIRNLGRKRCEEIIQALDNLGIDISGKNVETSKVETVVKYLRFPTKSVPMDYRVSAANASVVPRCFSHVFPILPLNAKL